MKLNPSWAAWLAAGILCGSVVTYMYTPVREVEIIGPPTELSCRQAYPSWE